MPKPPPKPSRPDKAGTKKQLTNMRNHQTVTHLAKAHQKNRKARGG